MWDSDWSVSRVTTGEFLFGCTTEWPAPVRIEEYTWLGLIDFSMGIPSDRLAGACLDLKRRWNLLSINQLLKLDQQLSAATPKQTSLQSVNPGTGTCSVSGTGGKYVIKAMSSDPCKELREVYDQCFQEWLDSTYFKGLAQKNSVPCEPQLAVYHECLKTDPARATFLDLPSDDN